MAIARLFFAVVAPYRHTAVDSPRLMGLDPRSAETVEGS